MAESSRDEHLRLVVDAAPIAIIVADENGRITLVNTQAERLFSYRRGEMLGQPLETLVPERFRRGHSGLRAGVHKTPSTRPMGAGRDLFGLRKDGTEVPIEIGLSPFITPDGDFVLATIVDITERKYAEELRLLTAREQRRRRDAEVDRDRALDASLLKSQFVATMSHELRTPLTTIIGMTELLSGTSLDDRQRRYCEQVNESAEALLSIINSILDFSKIEAGKIDLDERDFELQVVVESAASVLAPQVRQKSLRLHTYVDPLIPLVRGDADRLMQILLNLIGNAVKFTQRGSVVVRALPVETSLPRAVIRFEVQDTGIGISDETLPRLFEPFVQADSSSSRKYGGTGLGLSICKRLVTLMGGEIGVESEPARGSLFWFSVPFKRPTAVPSSRKVFGVCALIFSDDETFADIVVRYLEAWGLASRRIGAATDIRTALGSANAATPPEWIAVVDSDAPDFEKVAEALATRACMPVELVEAHQGHTAGFDGFSKAVQQHRHEVGRRQRVQRRIGHPLQRRQLPLCDRCFFAKDRRFVCCRCRERLPLLPPGAIVRQHRESTVLRQRPDLHVSVELCPVRAALSPALSSDAESARLGQEPPEVFVGDRGTEERGTAHPENVFGRAAVQPRGSRPPAGDPTLLIEHDQDVVDRDLFKVTKRDVNGPAVPDERLQLENAGFRRVQLPALFLNGRGQPRHQERDQERGDDEQHPRHWLNLRRQPRREERHERGDRSGRRATHRDAERDHGARQQE